MARQRHPPQSFRKSPARVQRVIRGRNAHNSRQFVSPSKHTKGPVLDKESLVRAKLQKHLANKPIATPLTDSDDSDRLVTKKKHAGKVQRPIYASGGVAQGDTPGAHPSRKRKSMDDGLDEGASAEKRRQTSQGSGLKRPAKPSLRSPLAPLLPNAILPTSPANPTPSSALVAPLASSAMRVYHNTSILPAAETSIIGTLKPRRRQPSILQIIETNDSSRITADDENEFLPDDESTPLPISKIIATMATPGSSLRRSNKDTPSSSGLRRPTSASKRATPSRMLGVIDSLPFSSSSAPRDLPVSDVTKEKTPTPVEGDSVLAPPISSSPEASPPKSRTESSSSSNFKEQTNNPMSTGALLSMMPKQSRRPQRQQKQTRSEFDIPEDSAGSLAQGDGPNDISEGSPFKPRRKTAAARTKRAGSNAPGGLRPNMASRKQRGASVLSNVTTNSKLSKNVQGAKSSAKSRALGGGARHFSTISDAKSRGVEKENAPLLDGLGDDDNELQKIREKFAEIDGWDMEFEDVEVLDQSSQEGFR